MSLLPSRYLGLDVVLYRYNASPRQYNLYRTIFTVDFSIGFPPMWIKRDSFATRKPRSIAAGSDASDFFASQN